MASRENARRFHFLREIASGGFGTVYLCKVVHADGFSRLAAVKILKAQWSDSDEVVRRIRDEARLLGLLRHRNIITVSDLTSIDGRTAVVMEYVEGVDLRAVVRHQADAALDGGGAVPARVALDATAAVAGALDAAYNRPPLPGEKPLRVIHRDIKPSNVMIDRQGEIKVLDFGVARSDLADRESHTEELQFGSVDYMAPERLFFEPETPAGDVYALGATLYELLALEKLGKARGRPEQHAAAVEDRLSYMRAVMRLRGTVATELTDLVRACVAFEHERRPTSAEVQQRCRALSRLAEGEELQTWAERVIPPLFEEVARLPAHAAGLTDTVRTEDSISRGFRGELPAAAGLPATGPSNAVEDLGARLRRGALRELEDGAARPAEPVPDPGQPFRPRPAPAPVELDEDAGDEWTDLPTNVGPLVDPTALPEPRQEDAPAVLPPRPTPSRAPPAEPATGDLPGPRALSGGGMTIAPATGAPVGGPVGGPVVRPPPPPPTGEDIGPGYEVEATSHQADLGPPRAPTGAVPGLPSGRPPGRGRAVVLGGLAGGCLLVVVSGALLAGGAFWWARSGGALPSLLGPGLPEAAAEVVAAAPVEEVPPPGEDAPAPVEEAPAAAAGGLSFESLAGDTRKLTVRCTGGDGSGETQARVDLAQAERCMVTAIMADRSRLVAVVDQAAAGSYACFAGGEERCERR